MPTETLTDFEAILADIREQLKALTDRVAQLEGTPAAAAAPPTPAAVTAAAPPPPEPEHITEEELLAISAALAAYLGVKVKVRQIRLIRSAAWAQQGRVSIQASHRLNY